MTTTPLLDAELLADWERCWERHGVAGRSLRAKPLSDDARAAAAAAMGVQFVGELDLWWRFHDGMGRIPAGQPGGSTPYFGEPWFLRLEQSVAEHVSLKDAAAQMATADLPQEVIFDPTWVPLTHNLHGGDLVCDSIPDEIGRHAIRYVEPGDSEIPAVVIVPSLGTLVTWWIRCYDIGAYRIVDGRWRLHTDVPGYPQAPGQPHVWAY